MSAPNSLLEEKIAEFQDQRSIDDKSNICHAPYQSLYFGQRGEVVACCYNRDFVLGTYPEDTIRDIWTGKKANALRKAMKDHTRMPRGCKICENQLCAGNFAAYHGLHFDTYAEVSGQACIEEELPYPTIMEFELSNACNLECVMCHGGFSSTIRKKREELAPLDDCYDDAFADQLTDFIPHLKEARFLGGEPFIIAPYYRIWDKIIEINPDVLCSITTNGSILNPRIKRTVEGLNRPQIVMSIDSIVRETYDKIRIQSDYDQVQESINYYAKVCASKGRHLAFATCPMTLNWREMPDLVRHCSENEYTIYFNTVVFPRFVSLRHQDSALLAEILEVYEKVELPTGTWLLDDNARAFGDLTSQVRNWHEEALQREADPTACDVYYWRSAPIEEVRSHPRIDAMAGRITASWDSHDANLARRLYEGRDDLGETTQEQGIFGLPQALTKEDLFFVRDYLYGSLLACLGQEPTDDETAAELRRKIELHYQHFQNFSDKGSYLEKLLATSPRAFVAATSLSTYDELLYDPTRVFATESAEIGASA